MTKGKYIRTTEIKKKNSESRKGKGIGTCGKYVRTEEIKEKQHQKMKGHPTSDFQKQVLKEIMLSPRNPMNDPEIIKRISGENSHRFGKPPIPGKIYLYNSPFQRIVKLNHSWEYLYAKYLDSINISWYHEFTTFKFKFNGKETSYTPDFFLPSENKYMEIKGWWRRDAEQKFEEFKLQYPDVKIELLKKKNLKRLGIKIK